MATTLRDRYVPKSVNPMRQDAPGAVRAMPSPHRLHHFHIYSDENYEATIAFYTRFFNGETIAVQDGGGPPMTFLSFDDHDHRVVIVKRPGWGAKPERAVGVSHLAFCYRSLGELIYVYEKMKEWGYPPYRTVSHGNSTSFYYRDPDGNEIEAMMDNFSTLDSQTYKRHYQFSDEFGATSEGNFEPDKLVALYEAGVPDSVLLDREEVRRLVREGAL